MTIVNLADEAPDAIAYGQPGYDALIDLWHRLARPFDVVTTVAALTGLSPKAVAQVVGMALATSPEAERLLDEMPKTIRSLATSMVQHYERCKGELRGPVLWSETMSARASSFGDDDLYIGVTPSKVYDVDENRVLVAALVLVREAAAAAVGQTRGNDAQTAALRVARRNGNDAGRFVEHPSLARVAREHPNGRALRRTRSGKKRQVYEPALQVLRRAANPLSVDDVASWCDRRTRAQFAVFAGLLDHLERAGVAVPPIRTDHGRLVAGPVAFRHGRALGDHRSTSGITAPGLLIDVPDDLSDRSRQRAEDRLAARAGSRDVVVVFGAADIDVAAARILDRS